MNDEIQLRAVLETLIKNKTTIVLVFLVFFLGVWVYGKAMDDLYVSKVVILPVNTDAAKVGGTLAGFAGNLGFIPGELSQNQESKKLMVFLNSNRLASLVATHVGESLYQELFPGSWDHEKKVWILQPKNYEMAEALRSKVKFQENFEFGTISLIAKFKSPELPARVLEAYLVVLQEYVANNELTTAERNKNFVGKQLQSIKKTFLKNAKFLSEYHNKLEISSLRSSVDVDLDHPMYTINGGKDVPQGYRSSIIKNLPADIYLKYLMSRQDILSNLIVGMEQQHQISLIEAAKDRLSFHVIDKPEIPVFPDEPNRRYINMIGAVIGVIVGIFVSFLKEFWQENVKSA